MIGYQRPSFSTAVFRDTDGVVIPCGSRWAENPPEAAYSVTHHLERFAPLVDVADALVGWLTRDFDVTVDASASAVAGIATTGPELERAVRITPADPHSAPLTVAVTTFPGVIVHAGATSEFVFPVCGCDACDDDVPTLAEDLEWTVGTVINGGFAEWIEPAAPAGSSFRLAGEGRAAEGPMQIDHLPPDRLSAMSRMPPPDGRWMPWARRARR